MVDIKNYPTLVDTIWKIVQNTSEKHEQEHGNFSQEHIAKKLGVPHPTTGEMFPDNALAIRYGIESALQDLINLEYCNAEIKYAGHHWPHISPSPNYPSTLPSVLVSQSVQGPFAPKLSPLQRKALQFVHDRTIYSEKGITFYCRSITCEYRDAAKILMPETDELNMLDAINKVNLAIQDLQEWPFQLIEGHTLIGGFRMWATLKGACLLLAKK